MRMGDLTAIRRKCKETENSKYWMHKEGPEKLDELVRRLVARDAEFKAELMKSGSHMLIFASPYDRVLGNGLELYSGYNEEPCNWLG